MSLLIDDSILFSPIQTPEGLTLEIPEQNTLSCLLISSLPYAHTPFWPPRGSIQRSPSDPNLSGSVPLAVVPSQTLPTAPPSRYRLTVKVKSNPLLVALDLILTSPTDLTVGVPLAGTPPASRANDPGLISLLCRSNRLPRPHGGRQIVEGRKPTITNLYL